MFAFEVQKVSVFLVSWWNGLWGILDLLLAVENTDCLELQVGVIPEILLLCIMGVVADIYFSGSSLKSLAFNSTSNSGICAMSGQRLRKFFSVFEKTVTKTSSLSCETGLGRTFFFYFRSLCCLSKTVS